MASLGTYLRLMRAGFILVREGVVSSLPAEDLPGAGAILGMVLRGCSPSAAPKAPSAPTGSPAPWSGWGRPGSSSASSSPPGPMWSAPRLPTISPACRTGWRPSPKPRPAPPSKGSLGRPISELFSRFDPPIAAASIAQVHPAEVSDENGTRQVAVKVVRPGVRQRFKRDLEAFYLVSELQERFIPVLAPAAPGGNHQDARADHPHRDGSAARGRGPVRDG
jgi:ubiquinone biosynthesis protein